MTDHEMKLIAVIGDVRTCFNLLKSLADMLTCDLDINPSMRAVLEALSASGDQTVPQIARQKNVSRQHIQTIMNDLGEGGYVDLIDNPEHRRSPIFTLTNKGKHVFQLIKERESQPLREIAAAIPAHAVDDARQFLTNFNRQLEQQIEKGSSNDIS